ncbi:MAG: hypothetical protein J3K34DRAFT_460438 [Monoraphidium minutum]|nr:MAG: hypothetical protein J3K34DRAFT_460438 [Monoraphidium minutum]
MCTAAEWQKFKATRASRRGQSDARYLPLRYASSALLAAALLALSCFVILSKHRQYERAQRQIESVYQAKLQAEFSAIESLTQSSACSRRGAVSGGASDSVVITKRPPLPPPRDHLNEAEAARGRAEADAAASNATKKQRSLGSAYLRLLVQSHSITRQIPGLRGSFRGGASGSLHRERLLVQGIVTGPVRLFNSEGRSIASSRPALMQPCVGPSTRYLAREARGVKAAAIVSVRVPRLGRRTAAASTEPPVITYVDEASRFAPGEVSVMIEKPSFQQPPPHCRDVDPRAARARVGGAHRLRRPRAIYPQPRGEPLPRAARARCRAVPGRHRRRRCDPSFTPRSKRRALLPLRYASSALLAAALLALSCFVILSKHRQYERAQRQIESVYQAKLQAEFSAIESLNTEQRMLKDHLNEVTGLADSAKRATEECQRASTSISSSLAAKDEGARAAARGRGGARPRRGRRRRVQRNKKTTLTGKRVPQVTSTIP